MADVSLDDLIKKDKEQNKANRTNKVHHFLFRSLLRKSSLPKSSSPIKTRIAKTRTSRSRNRTTVPSKRNSSKSNMKITEINPENPENLEMIENSDRISLKTDLPRKKKASRTFKINNTAL
jgi:hypothetical protein